MCNSSRMMWGNYLRVRGEYPLLSLYIWVWWELPPRARRILHPAVATRPLHGTTSACAENTCRRIRGVLLPRNYLRVRGEYPK